MPARRHCAGARRPARAPAGTRVIILGAGVAGLTAAYELRKLGYECEILEARARFGGRCFTVRRGRSAKRSARRRRKRRSIPTCTSTPGAARIPHHHTTTLDYCRELGVAIEPFCSVNEAAFVHHSSAAHGRQRLRLREVRADWRGQTSELLAKAVSSDALDRPMSAEDRDRILEWLKLEGGLSEDLRYAGSARRGYASAPGFGTVAGVVDDPLRLDDLLRTGFGKYLATEINMQTPMFQVVGGTDGIVRALAAKVGHITLGAAVQAIEQPSGRVRVRYTTADGASRQAEGAFCISTLPLTLLRDVSLDASSDAARRGRGHQLLERGQDRAAVLAAFLGGGRRNLWRHHANRSGDHADSLSVDRDTSRARGCSSATIKPALSLARWATWRPRSDCSARSIRDR